MRYEQFVAAAASGRKTNSPALQASSEPSRQRFKLTNSLSLYVSTRDCFTSFHSPQKLTASVVGASLHRSTLFCVYSDLAAVDCAEFIHRSPRRRGRLLLMFVLLLLLRTCCCVTAAAAAGFSVNGAVVVITLGAAAAAAVHADA